MSIERFQNRTDGFSVEDFSSPGIESFRIEDFIRPTDRQKILEDLPYWLDGDWDGELASYAASLKIIQPYLNLPDLLGEKEWQGYIEEVKENSNLLSDGEALSSLKIADIEYFRKNATIFRFQGSLEIWGPRFEPTLEEVFQHAIMFPDQLQELHSLLDEDVRDPERLYLSCQEDSAACFIHKYSMLRVLNPEMGPWRLKPEEEAALIEKLDAYRHADRDNEWVYFARTLADLRMALAKKVFIDKEKGLIIEDAEEPDLAPELPVRKSF